MLSHKVSNNCSDDGSNEGTQVQHSADEVVVDDGGESSIKEQFPCCFCCLAESLSIDCNLGKSIHVEISEKIVEASDNTVQKAGKEVVVASSCRLDDSFDGFEDCNKETSQTNTSEGGGGCSFEGLHGWIVWSLGRCQKIPGRKYSTNSDVNNIFENLSGPKEGNEQQNNAQPSLQNFVLLSQHESSHPEEAPSQLEGEEDESSDNSGWKLVNYGTNCFEHDNCKRNSSSY